ncbi:MULTISPECIES: cupin domain-containing protein [unclassified Microbacterium]|uniref:cupin domain-containing protein n=1 Tax=unclassified Microbacterium TaxID=2609290 RepID=UPI001AD45C91|nr:MULTISPECIES: cupin domain-containing protein [unclassified Microbacterium]MBN9157757.1 cupin domain-containing protein [Microbacterium sp.]MBS1900890.1 cupin domain-containing protein [Actinomycetota bacterium]
MDGTAAAAKPTTDEGPDRDFWISHLGAQLREQRTGRYTVEELAERAGVSAGLISQIERGIGNPSFATLLRLANSLDLPLASMFADPDAGNDHMVVRRADRRRIEIPSQGIIMELIVPDSERKLGVVNMTIPAHFDGASVPHSHEGEECVMVTAGSLVASVAGREVELEAGDSLTYDASLPHWWSNRTDSAAVMLAISTPPSLGRAH